MFETIKENTSPTSEATGYEREGRKEGEESGPKTRMISQLDLSASCRCPRARLELVLSQEDDGDSDSLGLCGSSLCPSPQHRVTP